MSRALVISAFALGVVVAAACASSSEAKKEPAKPAEPTADTKAAPPPPAPEPAVKYPDTRLADHVDEYHGTKVPDPYRWLEDPDSEETRKWVEAQNQVTFGYLGKITSREVLKMRLTELWNYERFSPPFHEGKRYFYFKNDGLQNQSVLYTLEKLDAEPKVLLDPNALSADGTIALNGLKLTDDGTLMAYGLSNGGSDWVEWRVKDVATGNDLPDVIKWSKFSGASWSKDKKGFFYSRYPEPKEGDALEEANYFHKVYYHRLGTEQKDDELVFEDKDNKTRGFDARVTEDGKYLIIHVWEGTDRRNRLYFKEMKKGAPVVKLFDAFDGAYDFIGNKGGTFFIKTDLDAPRGRLVAVDVKKADKKNWKELIPQGADKLEFVTMLGGGFLAGWLHDAHTLITLHDIAGKKTKDISLPAIGTAMGFDGKSTDTETFYGFTSFNYPTTIFRLDVKTGESTLFRQPQVSFKPEDYEVRQEFYPSKDGTKVPMFLVHKKGLAMDGNRCTYLYGYGGFNVSLTPSFSVPLIAWLERGCVYAQPTLRGGGEYGEDWHSAGMLDKKQNVFDDFISAAEFLTKSGITKPEKLAIGGGSNGGLLVGACITQRPELFGAALAQVGVMDMLRFHKFTIGHAWTSEYGSSDDAAQFQYLMKYSPLHNLKPGMKYPATLITTADHDDRVVPAHSFKFAAAIQKAQGGVAPVIIRIDTKAGHGAGKPTSKLIEENADKFAFLLHELKSEQ
ncbi:MAG: prolyl oligopeptidase family serine peptidase [Myxococcota bacterium]